MTTTVMDAAAAQAHSPINHAATRSQHERELKSILKECVKLSDADAPTPNVGDLMRVSGRFASFLEDVQSAHWALHVSGQSSVYSEIWCQRIEAGIMEAMFEATNKHKLLFLSQNYTAFWAAAKRIRHVFRFAFASYSYAGGVEFNEVYAGALSASLITSWGGASKTDSFLMSAARGLVGQLRPTHSMDFSNLHALFAVVDASLFAYKKPAMMKEIPYTGACPSKPSDSPKRQFEAIGSELAYEHELVASAEGNFLASFDQLRKLKIQWLGDKKHILSDPLVGLPKFAKELVPEHLAELCMCFEFVPDLVSQQLTDALKAHTFSANSLSGDIVEELRVWFESLTTCLKIVNSSKYVTRAMAGALLKGCHDGVKGAVINTFGDSFSTFLATQMGAFLKARKSEHFHSYAKLLVFLPNVTRFTDEYERRLVDRLLLHPVRHVTAERTGFMEINRYLAPQATSRIEAILCVAESSVISAPTTGDVVQTNVFLLPGLLVPDSSLPSEASNQLLSSSTLGATVRAALTRPPACFENTTLQLDGALSTAEVEVSFVVPDGGSVGKSTIFGSMAQLAVIMALDPAKPPRPLSAVSEELGLSGDCIAAIRKTLGSVIRNAGGDSDTVELNVDHLAANKKVILPRVFR